MTTLPIATPKIMLSIPCMGTPSRNAAAFDEAVAFHGA